MSSAVAILLFTASWCGPCQDAERDFAHESQVQVIDVDSSYGQMMVDKHNVLGIPSILTDEDELLEGTYIYTKGTLWSKQPKPN